VQQLGPAYERLVAKLAEAGQRGNNGSWTCPAHEDSNPSLSVSRGERGVVLHCHAGCGTPEVVAALGMKLEDLFDDDPQPQRSHVDAVYPYHDEGGELLYEVVRFVPKDFRQRRPVPGGYEWRLGGARRVLYRLPEVRRAALAGETVWLCEGEKDADAVRALGACGTTNPGGAGKWREHYCESLIGAQVMIVAHADDPGREHAAKAKSALEAHGISATVLEPAVGNDLSDHLGAGLGLSQLVPQTPVPTGSHALAELIEPGPEFIASAGQTQPQIIRGMLTAGGIAIYGAEPKTGKTWLATYTSLCVANGLDLFGQYEVPEPGRVLYIASEGSREGVIARLKSMALGMGLEPEDAVAGIDFIWRRGFSLGDEAALEALAQLAAEYRLVVIDVLAGTWDGREDSNEDAGRLMRSLAPITAQGCTVAIVHHFGKLNDATAMRRPGQRLRGASAFHGAVDSGIYLERGKNDTRTTVTIELKDGAPVDPFSFSWPSDEVDGTEPCHLDWQAGDRQQLDAVEAVPILMQTVRDHPGESRNGIAKFAAVRKGTATAALAMLVASGQLVERRTEYTDAAGRTRRRQGLYVPEAVAEDWRDALV
jgi:hypothetical protein